MPVWNTEVKVKALNVLYRASQDHDTGNVQTVKELLKVIYDKTSQCVRVSEACGMVRQDQACKIVSRCTVPEGSSDKPTTIADAEAEDLLALYENGVEMCRQCIDPEYIQAGIDEPDASIWTIYENKELVGFALTKTSERMSTLHLSLICSNAIQKRTGLVLFANILTWAVNKELVVQLEAVNKPVAQLYLKEARQQNLKVTPFPTFGEQTIYADIDTHILFTHSKIGMRIEAKFQRESKPRTSLTQTASSLKAMMIRAAQESGADSEDDENP